MKKDSSRNQLSKSLQRRLNHMMIQVLTQFENQFSEVKDDKPGSLYRFNVRNVVNDVIRASQQELQDYDIDYRPLRVRGDSVLSMTKEFMESIESIDFIWKDGTPGVHIHANQDRMRILAAVRSELECGVIYSDGYGDLVLSVFGIEDCIDSMVPFLDKFTLISGVRQGYQDWRADLVARYIGR